MVLSEPEGSLDLPPPLHLQRRGDRHEAARGGDIQKQGDFPKQGDFYSTSELDRLGERLTLSRRLPALRNLRGAVLDSNNPCQWLRIILAPFEIWCKSGFVKSRAH